MVFSINQCLSFFYIESTVPFVSIHWFRLEDVSNETVGSAAEPRVFSLGHAL